MFTKYSGGVLRGQVAFNAGGVFYALATRYRRDSTRAGSLGGIIPTVYRVCVCVCKHMQLALARARDVSLHYSLMRVLTLNTCSTSLKEVYIKMVHVQM